MKDKLLHMLFQKTYPYVKVKLEDDKYKETYYIYLSNKYGRFFAEIDLEEESNEKIKEIVDCYSKIELDYLKDFTKLGILTIIRDESFEYLISLSDQASDDVWKCIQYGENLCGEENYKLRINELIQCIFEVKKENHENAKKLLLNCILDLNYAFGKSDFTSLDLLDII